MKLRQAAPPLATLLVLTWAFWSARGLVIPPPPELPRGLTQKPIPEGEAGYRTVDDCRGCHQDAYRAWVKSRHSHAARGDLFQIGFRVEPMKWCLTCHSPGQPDPNIALTHGEGVTCAACHNREGGIATSTPPHRWGRSPHRLVYDPALADGTTCATCHQSDLPLSRNINQDTMDEWTRAGGVENGRCIDCHMPREPGAGHEFVGTRDAQFLARSIPIAARFVDAAGQIELEIAIGPARAGHGVPTGDPFRELAVVWSVEGPDGRPLVRGEELLGRRSRVVEAPGGKRRMLELDERLNAGERRVWRRAIPAGARGPLRARVTAMIRLLAGEMTRLEGFPGLPVETRFAELSVAHPAR